jgi:hypothetical protein
MQKLFYIAITAASIIASAAPGSAVAAPIDYVLNGATVTYNNGATDSLTGNFRFDPTTATLSLINITESAPAPGPNIFDMPTGATASSIMGSSSLDAQLLNIAFQASLGIVSDPLQSVTTMGPSGLFTSVSVTGSAVPVGVTPIPPSVMLFGTALALFALVLYGRNLRMGMSFSSVQRFA